MLRKLVQGAAGASLLAASALAMAGEPITLSEAQMDTVSAGATLPNLSDMGSLGAVSWSFTRATTGRIGTIVIDADFNGAVGLLRNGTFLNIDVRFVRPS